METKILDVGCGSRPRGDVNVDLRTNVDPKISLFLEPQDIPNLVLADVSYLPFKDSIFEKVLSSHVIEHVDKPHKMLEELLRVAKKEITIQCPHKMSEHPLTFARRHGYHQNFFNQAWFKNVLRKQPKVKGLYTEITKWKPFPNYLMPLMLFPKEITTTIYVRT